jgi:hypothetical protein
VAKDEWQNASRAKYLKPRGTKAAQSAGKWISIEWQKLTELSHITDGKKCITAYSQV